MVDLKIQLPDGFLNEEVRCDYLVTHEMKKAWAVMLDLLAEFDRVCRKYDIKYFASGGTMLGAVRHKGFIPWDDDIDVMMERKDYERLCEIGPSEFQHPYFLQNKYTDPECCDIMSKLRNSDTTSLFGLEKNGFMNYNKGIFIDIFPLDSIPMDQVEQDAFYDELNEELQRMYRKGRGYGIFTEESRPFQRFIKKTLHSLLYWRRKFFIKGFWDACRSYEKLCQKYNDTDTLYFSTIQFRLDRSDIKYKSDYKETELMDFEFLKIPVGKNFDHGLRVRYGDNYMEFVKGASCHSGIFFDTDKSYKDYA